MKKKFMMLSCIAAVAIATIVGKKTFESQAYEAKSLLMQNVEALSTPSDDGGDNGFDDDVPTPCKYGAELYATIGTGQTETTVRTHYEDGDGDNPGTDIIQEVTKEFCIGTGIGKKKGVGNAIIRTNWGVPSTTQCLGPLYHTSL